MDKMVNAYMLGKLLDEKTETDDIGILLLQSELTGCIKKRRTGEDGWYLYDTEQDQSFLPLPYVFTEFEYLFAAGLGLKDSSKYSLVLSRPLKIAQDLVFEDDDLSESMLSSLTDFLQDNNVINRSNDDEVLDTDVGFLKLVKGGLYDDKEGND